MKKIMLLPLLTVSLLVSCNCKKTLAVKTPISSTIQTNCPENGICTIEVLNNKELNVNTDEFGSVYFTLTDNPNTSVIQYQYNRNVKEGLQDASHKEEIIFEVSNSDTKISLENSDLQKTKMLFGRICFCRGQTGYYKVTKGKLQLNKTERRLYKVDLEFKISQVPQLFDKVQESVIF